MKAIVFDFDGTLTKESQNIWRMVWQKCGYTTDKDSLYAKLYVSHVIEKKITRKQWFDYTCKAFKDKGMTYKDVRDVARQIETIDGFEDAIKALYEKGYSLHILSGGLKDAIEIVIGKNLKYFDHIESNRPVYDVSGDLIDFIPTDYDYEGKAKYIEKLIEQGYKPQDILFVGNSYNDEWVHSSGCHTICINPHNTDEGDSSKWDRVYKNVQNLTEIFGINEKQTTSSSPDDCCEL